MSKQINIKQLDTKIEIENHNTPRMKGEKKKKKRGGKIEKFYWVKRLDGDTQKKTPLLTSARRFGDDYKKETIY